MIKKLYHFGKYIPKNYFEDNPMNLNLDYGKNGDKKIVFINFLEKGGDFEYQRINIEDYDSVKNLNKYLFKNAKGNSVSPFPTVFYDVTNLSNKRLDFESKSGNKILRILENNNQINPALRNILKILKDNKIKDNVYVEKNFILSIKINNKYIGESSFYIPIITQYKDEIFLPFYKKHNTESRSKNKICYLCQNSSEVWGFVDLNDFKFYSVNEDSVIAGGFKKEYSWRNYPVCPLCSVKLFKYKCVIEKYLTFRLYGFNYYLVPEIIFDKVNNREILDTLTNENYGLLNLKKLDETIEMEDDLLDLLKSSSNFLNYTLFFYKQNNSEFKIILSIDNVFPSRFRELYNVKNKINKFTIFKNLKGIYEKDKINNLRFNFGILRHFFPASKKEGDFSKSFLEMIRSIFIGKKIDYDLVISRIISKIRNNFINDYNTEFNTLKAMLLMKFLTALNLWNRKDNAIEKELIMNNKYEDFFNEHDEFFENNTKKAIFLEGVLCQFLLNIQYRERKSTPFKARLNSLKVDEQILKRLLPEIINKLEEYDSNYYQELESIISEYLLDSKFMNMTNDEISFYFVMGMNLSKKFKTKINKEEEQDGNN